MQELLRGASVAFALKVLAAGLAFGLNVVLARLLGAEGSGIFFLAFTVVLFVAAISRIGMENALVRFIAANVAANQPGKILGVYQKAMFYSLTVATLLSPLLYLSVPWSSQVIFSKPELTEPRTQHGVFQEVHMFTKKISKSMPTILGVALMSVQH